jgi:hypothetical protein
MPKPSKPRPRQSPRTVCTSGSAASSPSRRWWITSATPLGLEEAHRDLRISPAEFDAVAAELGRTLDFFKVPKREKAEVLAAFAAHKDEVTAGYSSKKSG